MNEWTKHPNNDLFTLEEGTVLPLEKEPFEWVRLSIEMDLNRLDYSRVRYNFLDLLAQFGGFMGIFRWIFTTFMAAWNTNALDNFMVSKLYKVQAPSKKQSETSEKPDEAIPLKRGSFPHCGEYLISWIPTPFLFCSRGKVKNRARARALLNQEMNMVKLLKQ